jgi:hypothetical protein
VGEDTEAPRYRFGPLERRGLVAGWRGGQIVTVAAALVAAVFLLRVLSPAAGVAAAVVAMVIGVGAATWPIGGRTVEEWAPDAVRHASALRRRRTMRGGGPFVTLRVLDVDLSGTGAGSGGRMGAGVVHDVAGRTYTAVLDLSAPGFVLLAAPDKARRVGQWAAVLASLAREGTVVHRVQWIERSLPDDGADVRRHLAERAVLDPGGAQHRSYAALLEDEVSAAHRHEVLLAVTVHAGNSARAVRAAGGGHRGACIVLLRETAALARRLTEASVDVAGVLGVGALTGALRRGFDPEAMAGAADRGADGRMAGAVDARNWPWPMGMESEWGRVRVDAMWHATYWIAEWPRTDVVADFLGPLLLVSDVRRSVSVVMEPVGARLATRRIEQSRTADIADAELRRRGGFLATARRGREEEVLARREVELADGHAPFRFSGYVTVSAGHADELEEACGRVEQASGRAGLELRRCYGTRRAPSRGLCRWVAGWPERLPTGETGSRLHDDATPPAPAVITDLEAMPGHGLGDRPDDGHRGDVDDFEVAGHSALLGLGQMHVHGHLPEYVDRVDDLFEQPDEKVGGGGGLEDHRQRCRGGGVTKVDEHADQGTDSLRQAGDPVGSPRLEDVAGRLWRDPESALAE